jgi:hypothetical protein
MTPTLRSIAFWTGIILLVVVSGLGFQSAMALDPAQTVGQQVAMVTQFGYALTGTLAAVGLVGRRRWAAGLAWLWAGLITLTAALAPVVWGGSGVMAGLIAGVVTAIVAALIVWLTRAR